MTEEAEKEEEFSDDDDETFDLRAELRREVSARAGNSVLQSLSRSKPGGTGAAPADLRSLVLHFICPLTKKIMHDPVISIDGLTYERRAITTWFVNHSESPITGQKLSSKVLIPNLSLLQQIRKFYPSSQRRGVGGGTGTRGMLSVSNSPDGLMAGMSVDFLACLPLALLGYQLEFLDHRALCRIGACNKELHQVSRDNRLWKLAGLRRGFDISVAMVRELGNDFKALYKVRLRQAQPVNQMELARRKKKEENFKGVYLIPAGAPGTSINLAF